MDRSTTTASLPFGNLVSEGFNANKPASRTALVAIDISKAFDMVDITLLLEQISSSNLHHNYVRWLSSYLRGRKAACIYQGHQSRFRTVHIRVPQGSIISLALFNFFTSDFPEVSDTKASFADNFTAGASDLKLEVIAAKLNVDLKCVSKWANIKPLTISADKSQIIFFTLWNQEKVFPQIYYEGKPIPVAKEIKILGLSYDSLHAYTLHVTWQNPRVRVGFPS
jgi:hypothetical protein